MRVVRARDEGAADTHGNAGDLARKCPGIKTDGGAGGDVQRTRQNTVIGRTHRSGQEADEVTVDILLGCREHYDAFQRALDGARAAADTLGHAQKILLADLCLPNIDNKTGPLWGKERT